MDTKDISAVLLKTVGLVMVAFAVFEIPAYLPPRVSLTEEYSLLMALVDAAAILTLPIVLGLLLWFFPATVVNKIVSGEKLSGERFGVLELERVALIVVGAWLVAYGITDLTYGISSMVVMQKVYDQTLVLGRYAPGLVTSIVKIALGLGLALGATGVAGFIRRIRGEG